MGRAAPGGEAHTSRIKKTGEGWPGTGIFWIVRRRQKGASERDSGRLCYASRAPEPEQQHQVCTDASSPNAPVPRPEAVSSSSHGSQEKECRPASPRCRHLPVPLPGPVSTLQQQESCNPQGSCGNPARSLSAPVLGPAVCVVPGLSG